MCSAPLTLCSHLPQSLEQLIGASREDLALCPGLGPQKVRALGMGLAEGQEGGPPRNRTPDPKVLRFQKAHSASPTDGENQGQERVETS